MKKVSTRAAKQSRNFSQHKLTMGLDVGDGSSYYCVLDENGNIVLEHKVATTPKALPAAFGEHDRSLSVTFALKNPQPWVLSVIGSGC